MTALAQQMTSSGIGVEVVVPLSATRRNDLSVQNILPGSAESNQAGESAYF